MARILIVEDEARIASFLAKGLRAEGHVATVTGDGRDGLDHAMSGEHDLVILDIGLPSLDGFDVLDQLRSQGSRVPVIVLTARDSVTGTGSSTRRPTPRCGSTASGSPRRCCNSPTTR